LFHDIIPAEDRGDALGQHFDELASGAERLQRESAGMQVPALVGDADIGMGTELIIAEDIDISDDIERGPRPPELIGAEPGEIGFAGVLGGRHGGAIRDRRCG
jgi:hypothetical protein